METVGTRSTLASAVRGWLALTLGALGGGLAAGCATGQGNGPDEYLTLRTEGATLQMRIEPSGRVSGSEFELATTDTGYRGMLSGQLADMMATHDGDPTVTAERRVIGTRGGQPIDLHVTAEGGSILATGTFAGRLGRLQLTGERLASSVGLCSVVLERADERRYVGERNCRGSVRFARTEIELPPTFTQLSPERKVMLLAALTGG
jgi:hypothetical protein